MTSVKPWFPVTSQFSERKNINLYSNLVLDRWTSYLTRSPGLFSTKLLSDIRHGTLPYTLVYRRKSIVKF
jgi:hypothetical protein